MAIDPRTPVLVGVGSLTQHADDRDPIELLEPVGLMVAAARAAAADAGASQLLSEVGLIAVPKGIWGYGDPGRYVAEQIGAAASTRTVLAEVGILQQTLIDQACTAIADGALDVALICGGEARNRAVRAARTGGEAPEVEAPGPPDDLLLPSGEIITGVEIERDLAVPAHQYALVESVLRHTDGITAEQQRRRLGALWSSFARTAAGNAFAWDRSAPGPDDIAAASADNRMIASPYTKRLCSQWNVDQGAALLLTSVGAAERLGVPRHRWVFPLAAAGSQAMIPLPCRASIERSPATALAGRSVLDHAAIGLDAVAHLDVYSCFPAAVQVQARELGLSLERPLTVTGGMTFAGGPLNSYVLHSTAAMADVLRADAGSVGLVTSVSGMLTKPGVALWSTEPGPGFRAADVTDEALATTETRPLDPDATGAGRIVAHTVVHERGIPARLVALVEMDDGRRTVAVDPDPDRAAESADLDLVGHAVRLPAPGTLG
ncbi:MAG: acetyl-CoA acetyltransferase [Acidimicrobiales bacterium]